MTSEEQEIEILKDAGLLNEAATHAVINFLCATWDSSLTKGEMVIQEALYAVRVELEVLEDTVEGHVKEVAMLKSKIAKRDVLINRWIKRMEDGWLLEHEAIGTVWRWEGL